MKLCYAGLCYLWDRARLNRGVPSAVVVSALAGADRRKSGSTAVYPRRITGRRGLDGFTRIGRGLAADGIPRAHFRLLEMDLLSLMVE